jgi:hypothetical protein
VTSLVFNSYFVYCTIMDMENETVDNRLSDFLKEGEDWERKQTSVPGVFLLRLPPFRSRPACIAIEIDALNRGGSGGRKRGLIIRSKEEIKQLPIILNNDKVIELASAVEAVNPVQTSSSSTVDSEVFEI